MHDDDARPTGFGGMAEIVFADGTTMAGRVLVALAAVHDGYIGAFTMHEDVAGIGFKLSAGAFQLVLQDPQGALTVLRCRSIASAFELGHGRVVSFVSP